jgi:hypothetical protein
MFHLQLTFRFMYLTVTVSLPFLTISRSCNIDDQTFVRYLEILPDFSQITCTKGSGNLSDFLANRTIYRFKQTDCKSF